MQNELYGLIESSHHGDKEAMNCVINRFGVLIKSLSYKLNYDGADSDLTIALIEIVRKIPIYKDKRFSNDGCIVKYINISMKNEFIRLSKKNSSIKNTEVNIDFLDDKLIYNFEDNLFLSDISYKLSDTQKKVIKDLYINDYTISEVSKRMHISRQAVNQTKNRAFRAIRDYMGQGCIEYGE